jgi:DNA protecting protein DprA
VPSYDDAACIFLGLSQLKGIGFKTLRDLGGVDEVAERFRHADDLTFLDQTVRETLGSSIVETVFKLGEQQVELLRAQQIQIIRIGEPKYPRAFYGLPKALQPLWFFFRGDMELLHRHAVTVVGTRSPTDVGRFLARYSVAALSDLEIVIVSGLAKGVDEIAHEWAIRCSLPTISVLGTGLLRTYPPNNVGLADRIVAAGGLLISEYLPDDGPKGENFVWRNRLQAALGACVIAPEWNRSSGTAHTIKYAQSLRRPTISLQMSGAERPATMGDADYLFKVPSDHSSFLHLVGLQTQQVEVDATKVNPYGQRELFPESTP